MRTILHCDCNNFYASVECLYHPELRGKPVAVCGDQEARHGIVLAKNYAAKRYGIKTGNPIWMARQLCPDIVIVPPHYDLYMHHSELARRIYADYTDRVEPFGLDECWLDVTGSTGLFGDGLQIADALRRRVKEELGITISVGVSFNKVFAKLGSDMRKPDATTVIPVDGWKDIVWPLVVFRSLVCGTCHHQTAASIWYPHHWRSGPGGSLFYQIQAGEMRRNPASVCPGTGPLGGIPGGQRPGCQVHREQHHHAPRHGGRRRPADNLVYPLRKRGRAASGARAAVLHCAGIPARYGSGLARTANQVVSAHLHQPEHI